MKKLIKIGIVAMFLTVLGVFSAGTASAKSFSEALKESGSYRFMTVSDFMEIDMPTEDDVGDEEEAAIYSYLIEFDRSEMKDANVDYDSNDIIIMFDDSDESATDLEIPAKIGSYDVTCIFYGTYTYFESLESIKLPNSLKYISASNFTGKNVTELTLPSSLKYFGDENMSLMNISELKIPASIVYFGAQPEAKISKITVDGANKNYKVTDGILYTADGKSLVKATNENTQENLSVSDKVNNIYRGAFYRISTLKSVTVPKTVPTLYEMTFYKCNNLNSLYLSEITSLEKFFIDHDTTPVTLYSFGDNSNAKKYADTYGAKVTYVDLSAEQREGSDFTYKIDSDYNAVLTKYTGNDSSVTIPAQIDDVTVAGIDDALFITDSSGNPVKKDVQLTAESSKYFYVKDGVLFTTADKRLIYYPVSKNDTIYTIDDGVFSIGDYAFTGNSYLNILYVPSHISSFKLSAFAGCNTNLNIAVKPQGVDPSSVKASGTDYNTVKLTWNPVTNVTGYKVFRSTSSSSAGVEIADIAGYGNTVYYDKTAELGKTYYYSVAVYKNVDGATAYISEPSKSVKGAPVLNTPKVSSAKSAGYNSLKVTWNKISGAMGYYVYRSTNATSGWKLVKTITSGNTVTFTDTGLTCGTTYYYTVRAYRTQNGTTFRSGFVSSGTSGKPALSTPKVSSANAASYNSLKITWNKISGASGYYVYRSENATSGWKLVKTVASGNTVTYTDTGLTCGKTYYYTVRAYRTQNNTTFKSGFVSPGTAGTPLPSAPQISSAVSVSYNSIKITWNKIDGASGYYVYRSLDGKTGWKGIKTITSGNTVTYTDTGLTCGTTYYYTVRAYRTQGGAKYTGTFNSIKSCKPIPAAPASLKASAVTATSVKVSWSKVSGASGYMVYRLKSDGKGWDLIVTIASASATSYTDTKLVNGKTYTYTVKAYRIQGNNKVYGAYSKSGVKCTVRY